MEGNKQPEGVTPELSETPPEANPEAQEETPEAEPSKEVSPEQPDNGETPKPDAEEPKEREKSPEEEKLHRALKAERASVKELKAENAELKAKVEAFEAAELDRKTQELAASHNLTPAQVKALETLKTFDERHAIAETMNPPGYRIIRGDCKGGLKESYSSSHQSIAGKSGKQNYLEMALDEAKRQGILPEAVAQVHQEFEKSRLRRDYMAGLEDDEKIAMLIKHAIPRSARIIGKTTNPAY